ncbi:DUF6215 domain-containing protein [Streptomyces sp. NPDC004065]|uniref:DUF6215 domain-containing protein n=1 Tax=Streptomyces sp. NPDC004065 TaxID=3364689 RepID=UPI00384FDBFF
MIGFLVRRLPFWVREPLLIVVGSVFGVRIMYLAVHDREWVPAGIGLVFLVFTAVRVHMVVRVLRVRRALRAAAAADTAAAGTERAGAGSDTATVGAGTAAAAADTAAAGSVAHADVPASGAPRVPARSGSAAQPQPGARTAQKEPNAWGQAVAAVAVFGAIGAALWLAPDVLPSQDGPRPASCPGRETAELPKAYRHKPGVLTGDELCEALNRPDLARLLGTPGETATSVSGTNNTALLTDGKVAQPEAEVEFDTYTVHASATYNELSTAQYVKLMRIGGERDVKTLKVLGRPAVLSSDHTMKLEIDLGGSASGGPVEQGPLARTLSVALDPKDRGGSYDFTVWSKTGALPDDHVLVDIAAKVLPALTERPAPSAT